MTVKFDYYKCVKDKYCIKYVGPHKEILLQLKLVRPIIETHFPDVKIYIVCNDNLLHIFDGELNVLPRSQFKSRHEFGYVRDLPIDFSRIHPIQEIMDECEIQRYVIATRKPTDSRLCSIFTDDIKRNNSIYGKDLDAIKEQANKEGYEVKVNPPTDFIDNSGWVIGPDNYEVFLSGSKGIRTTFVQFKNDTTLFKNMFPDGEILKI